VRRAVTDVFARPEFRWEPRGHALQWLADAWNRFVAALKVFSDRHPLVADVIFWACVALLVGFLAHSAYVAWKIYRATVRPTGRGGARGAPPVVSAAEHRRRADALAREGRYAEALAHRFVALVLDLERAEALRYHPSKTPAEYVGEARLDQSGRATLAGLVARLYRHVFGAVPCDEGGYLAFAAAADGLTVSGAAGAGGRGHVLPD
jgi:uncharacterized protein DUF4129